MKQKQRTTSNNWWGNLISTMQCQSDGLYSGLRQFHLKTAERVQRKCENEALFLRLSLPFTLIRCDENNGMHHDKHEIFLTKFSSTTNSKWQVNVAFLNSSGVVWTDDILYVFRMRLQFQICVAVDETFVLGYENCCSVKLMHLFCWKERQCTHFFPFFSTFLSFKEPYLRSNSNVDSNKQVVFQVWFIMKESEK